MESWVVEMMIFCFNFHTFSHIRKMYGLRLETICLIWKKVAPRHILYIEIIANVRTVCTYDTVRSTARLSLLSPLAPFATSILRA